MQRYQEAVNWNEPTDSYTKDFLYQNIQQIWLDQDLVFGADALTWKKLSPEEKDVYKKVLGGLTLLDTKQTAIGMPVISLITRDDQKKAVLNFMGFMEAIHAKTYSSIFTSIITREETKEIFEWIKTQPHLQKKVEIIEKYYNTALYDYVNGDPSDIQVTINRYLCLVASVLLESFLFYSGFFYPLYLAGQGRMVACGEGISLICRDEAIHGLYVGILAQEIINELDPAVKDQVIESVYKVLDELYQNEIEYTKYIYDKIGLVDQVNIFLQYNANRALMNLGLNPKFPEVTDKSINPIVFNGLSTRTVNHDFFSTKGNGYVKAVNIEKLEDKHFQFDIVDEFAE